MKSLLHLKVIALFIFLSIQSVNAQDVCMVTSDFQTGEHFMVIYNKPTNLNGIDSVIIYRKQGMETVFSRIGSQDINLLSYYVDLTSNTLDTAKYAISLKDVTGAETPMSFYHQGVVLDYNPLGSSPGTLVWTKYKKENQVDETYQDFNCMMDETGLGAYVSMGYFMWYMNSWTDANCTGHPNAQYYIETTLPSCSITKANINTSRSNIKKQAPNSEAGIQTNGSIISMQISPNPVESNLNILFESKLLGAKLTIIDVSGSVVLSSSVTSTDMSIDMSNFSKGSYFLTVETSSKVLSKVFMKN